METKKRGGRKMVVSARQNEKWTKKKVTVAVVLLGTRATKKWKWIKLQLCNEQWLMVKSCHSKRIKLDREKEIWRKSFIFISFYKPFTWHRAFLFSSKVFFFLVFSPSEIKKSIYSTIGFILTIINLKMIE